MLLRIDDKGKQEMFVAIFQMLKNWSGYVSMCFDSSKLYIQAMDKSHVCLAVVEIKHDWFDLYECSENVKISVDSGNLCTLLNYSLKHNTIKFEYKEDDSDKLHIHFLNEETTNSNTTDNKKVKKASFNHYFELSLIDVDEDSLGVPIVDYDIEFNIEAKRWVEVVSELNAFGQDLNIKCSENVMELSANSETTKLMVNIPIDELDEFAIAEGEELSLNFSLNHICKMCSSTKLGNIISVALSSEYPMALKYDLGKNGSAVFFVAPKV